MQLIDLMVSIVSLARSNEESELKKQRVSEQWANKRRNATTEPIKARCPAWLKLSPDKKKFEIIKDRAKVVRQIFEESASGIGMYVIVQRLNKQKIPFWTWQRLAPSSVAHMLKNRAVLGEFQPCKMVEGKRVPEGDPIKGYFPRIKRMNCSIASPKVFGNVCNAGGVGKDPISRTCFPGSLVVRIANHRCGMTTKVRRGTYRFCSGAQRGLECERTGWRYKDFESSFLTLVNELDLASLLRSESEGRARRDLENEIASLRGEHAANEIQREKAFELLAETKVAKSFVARKLDDLQHQHDAKTAMLQTKQEELATLNRDQRSFSDSRDHIKTLLERWTTVILKLTNCVRKSHHG